jgi:hypothetical protein
MTGEGKARRVPVTRTIELADFQPAPSDNRTNLIQHPANQVLEFALQLDIALPFDGNGAAGEGRQPANSESNS